MGKFQFEKVDGIDPRNALEGRKEVVPSEFKQRHIDEETVRVYVKFDEAVSIEEGMRLIESRVLDGDSLNVSRTDEKGNAVVAIISSRQIENIRDLRGVTHIKVEAPVKPVNKRASLL